MTTEQVYTLVQDLVNKKLIRRIYPSHVILLEAQKEAKRKLDDYSKLEFIQKLRKLIREQRLFAGVTVNGHWISTNKNNTYDEN